MSKTDFRDCGFLSNLVGGNEIKSRSTLYIPASVSCFQATFEKLENEMKEVNTNAEALKKNFLELTELKHILRKTQLFFEEVSSSFISSI